MHARGRARLTTPQLREAAGQALPVVARLWPLGGVKR